MTKDEYIQRMQADEEWAPGWDAIEAAFATAYPNMEPTHLATNIQARAMFGGDQYLDGYSIYANDKGYQHIVTFGMSELYTNEEAFGEEYSRWGYEMTMKLKADSAEECMWAIDMMSNLARYTFQSTNYFEHGEFVQGNGTSLHLGTDSLITALLVVNDTTIPTVDTVHGKVEFIQLVGITEPELEAIREDIDQVQVLIDRMKADNPEMITDMDRVKSYL